MRRAIVTVLVLGLGAGPAWADYRPLSDDLYADDFESSELKGWQGSVQGRLRRVDGNTVFEVGGPTEADRTVNRCAVLLTPGPAWADYAVEAKIRKGAEGWAGLLFRHSDQGHYQVWFDEAGRVTLRVGYQFLARSTARYAPHEVHRLRVVGIGPLLRVFVDGQMALEVEDGTSATGRAGLWMHHCHATFDDFTVTRRLTPAESTVLRVQTAGPANVFPLGQASAIPIGIEHRLDQPAQAVLSWTLSRGGRIAGQGRVPVALVPGKPSRCAAALEAGMERGLWRLEAALAIGSDQLQPRTLPVAVLPEPGANPAAAEPFFPLGVYDKYVLGGDDRAVNTCFHAICDDLVQHGMNTLVAGPMTRERLDIAARRGLRVILRVDRPLPEEQMRHPAVLAYMFGDEPSQEQIAAYRKRYDEVRGQYPGRPVVSCMVGEGMLTGAGNAPGAIWQALGADVRLVRCYPVRKAAYDLLQPAVYKGWMSAGAVFRAVQAAAPTPWWYVMQTFGQTVSEDRPEPYWRNPTAAEIRGMMHLALAYGAGGIIGWCYQEHPGVEGALVRQETLEPCDAKWAAMAEEARKIIACRQELLARQWGDWEARSDDPAVEAVPYLLPDKSRRLYVVNKDTRRARQAQVVLPRSQAAGADNLYTGRSIPVERSPAGPVLRLELAPGEGAFIRLEEKER